MKFDERDEYKKGHIGEKIVYEYLRSKGCVIYRPPTDCGHAFDRLAVSIDKKDIFLYDVKSKARRTFHADTGLDVKSYMGYKAISEKRNIPFFLFFVDEYEEKVYGNTLEELEKPAIVGSKKYPSVEKEIVYFPLSHMKTILFLTKEESRQLKDLSSRSYSYDPNY